jgi:glutamyl-Q tRNA(Asp) synthetase
VVSDDIEQGVTCVVRGADLLDSTPKQMALYRCFNAPIPRYLHIPLAVQADGSKLSKQNYAPAINPTQAQQHLLKALAFLGQPTEEVTTESSVDEILNYAIDHWSPKAIPRMQNLPSPEQI